MVVAVELKPLLANDVMLIFFLSTETKQRNVVYYFTGKQTSVSMREMGLTIMVTYCVILALVEFCGLRGFNRLR